MLTIGNIVRLIGSLHFNLYNPLLHSQQYHDWPSTPNLKYIFKYVMMQWKAPLKFPLCFSPALPKQYMNIELCNGRYLIIHAFLLHSDKVLRNLYFDGYMAFTGETLLFNHLSIPRYNALNVCSYSSSFYQCPNVIPYQFHNLRDFGI